LVPIREVSSKKDFWDRILAHRGRVKLAKGETWKDFINEGRRM
jgi:hypothetical protein